ncbi:MAG: hypothetical protein SGBAC_011061 [Bacillariaceae sp.]
MTDEDFMSIRSSDTGNSNIRDMTQRNSHTDSSRRSRSSIKDDEEANSNSSISNQNGAATEPLSIPSQIASPPRKLQQSDIGCTGRNTVGAIMCAVFAIAWIFFLFWKDGGSNLLTKPKSSGTGWNPPTTELCSSISNGVDIIGDSHLQERLQVKLELQLQSAPDDMNATALESDWKDKLQENVMPILAGCEDAMRRFLLASTKEGQTLRQRQRARSLNQLPDYVVSNALVVNTTLSWLEIVSQEEQESSLLEQSVYTYPLLVDIDLWLKEEVNNDLLVSRVSKVFNDFLEDTPLVTDLQLADSELVNVQQPPSTTTDNPTISDGFATSPSTTPEIPDSVTNAPVEMPTIVESAVLSSKEVEKGTAV